MLRKTGSLPRYGSVAFPQIVEYRTVLTPTVFFDGRGQALHPMAAAGDRARRAKFHKTGVTVAGTPAWKNARRAPGTLEANCSRIFADGDVRSGFVKRCAAAVVGHDEKTGDYVFFDCSAETPKGRTSVCYDREGLESRKEHQPANTALEMAAAMGVELLTEEQYQELQKLGDFDTKTSSWVKTPPEIRKLGGALYGDRRYGRVFVGHNGAQSYYAARAFRSWRRV